MAKDLISLKTITNKSIPISLKTINHNPNISSEKDFTKSNKKINSKYYINSSTNLDKNIINNTDTKKKMSMLTSNKLPRISNFENLLKDRIETNIFEPNKENDNHKSKKKIYKLKNNKNNNLEIKDALPEENTKIKKSNKKVVKMH